MSAAAIADTESHEVSWARELVNGLPEVHLPHQGDSVVYFVRCCQYVKIGTTSDMRARMSQFVTATPERPVLLAWTLGSYLEERALHDRFKADRSNGEWFRVGPDLAGLIVTIRETMGPLGPGPRPVWPTSTKSVPSAVDWATEDAFVAYVDSRSGRSTGRPTDVVRRAWARVHGGNK